MKKLLIVCLFVIGASAVSFAQGGGARTPADRITRLKTQVTGITADQETKLTAIYTAQAKSTDSLRTASGDDRQGMFAKMAPITTATNAKVRAILTADQQKQFDAIPPQGRGPGGGAPGGGAPRN